MTTKSDLPRRIGENIQMGRKAGKQINFSIIVPVKDERMCASGGKKIKNDIFTTLDVGCGEDYQGTVNTDRYPHDTSRSRYYGKNGFQRNLEKIPNFVKSDVNNLPFQDDSFEIVICSHLLEHLGVNLITACKELLRVAKVKVIISVPSQLSASRHAPSHDKVFTREVFDSLFARFQHKVRYQRFKLRTTMFPVQIINRFLGARKIKGLPNPFYYFPSPIPTEIQVEVTKYDKNTQKNS